MAKVRVAAVQAAPAYFDLGQSLERAADLTAEAARRGARLVAFGETWLPGYPMWLDACRDVAVWDHPAVKELYARLVANSVAVPSPATEALGEIARRNGVALVMGIHERVTEGAGRGTLYNSLLIFDADGRLAHRHRKLMPTYTERMIWGQGDGAGLGIGETAAGRVGGLVCWEHWMPLAHQAMHLAGEDVHVAAWPWVREMHLVASRHYAFEGRTFVVAVGSLGRVRDLPPELEPIEELRGQPDRLLLRGGSAIVAPDGRLLAGPVLDEEAILTADLDFEEITRESLTLDVTGHYARPDVFDFRVRR
jgi:predicted amidohydrolase